MEKHIYEETPEMDKSVILITEGYPYGRRDPFLENEIMFSKRLRFIFASTSETALNCPVPEDIYTKAINLYSSVPKIWRVLAIIFKREIYAELFSLAKSKKLKVATIKKMLWCYEKGFFDFLEIKKALIQGGGADRRDRMVFYSYWMNTTAITAVLLREYFASSIAITRCHGFDMYLFRHENQYIPFRGYICRYIDAIYPASDAGRTYIEKEYGMRPRCLITKQLGTIDRGFNEKVKRDVFRIVTCSGINKVKRVHLIVKALAAIRDISIEWVHFGDGRLRAETEEMARTGIGINITVIFKGWTQNDEILDFYTRNDCHLFINVSETEGGVPVSIKEAMSCGIPVIATDVGGNGEIVRHNESGILIEKDFRIEDMVDVIRRFHGMSPDDYITWRKAARRTWEEKYNAVDVYGEFYDEILGLATSAPPRQSR